MRCTVDVCRFDRTVCDLTGWKQLERQELLFAWWLISDQQTRSHWEKQVKPFIFSSTLKFCFCSFIFSPASKIFFSLVHPSQILSSVTTLFFLPLTLFAALWIFAPHLLCLSTLPSLPFSPLSPTFPPSSLALVLWKEALSAGLNSAGPLEAGTMGPSSEGSKAHERGTKALSPRGAPLCTSQQQPPLALHTVCLSACMWEKTCTFLPVWEGRCYPLGFLHYGSAPLKGLGFQLSF